MWMHAQITIHYLLKCVYILWHPLYTVYIYSVVGWHTDCHSLLKDSREDLGSQIIYKQLFRPDNLSPEELTPNMFRFSLLMTYLISKPAGPALLAHKLDSVLSVEDYGEDQFII